MDTLLNEVLLHDKISTTMTLKHSLQHIFPYLWLVKAHVVSHDVKLSYMGTSIPFDPLGYEGKWIAKLVAHWKGETQALLLTEAVEHVENGAAGCLVGLQEHDVSLGPA